MLADVNNPFNHLGKLLIMSFVNSLFTNSHIFSNGFISCEFLSLALLSIWCEELGRLLLLRHQKGRKGDSQNEAETGETSKMHQTMQKAGPQT
ncbi:hypothetical protein CDAR_441601 [Caerostris darwini]|uniref:Uncharacterized protein n=1 Tax=Caerostris darwini TaxID=1538125 RepID=A0AAV4QPP1_9ARAC|nr:hypothetical protein CDAR_441601 [Caerostris darwini]